MWRDLLMLIPVIVLIVDFSNSLIGEFGQRVTMFLIVVGFLIALGKANNLNWRKIALSALTSLIGALSTFLLSNHLHLGPLIASGLVGLLGARLFSEKRQMQIYLGAFVGMSSALRFPHLALLLGAGALGGVLWELLDASWVGVGGRLGTLAATAVLIILLVSGGVW